MSVDNPDVVDFVGIEPESGKVVLTVSDHLDWKDVDAHILLLQAKLDAYLHFVESGELVEAYPVAAGRSAAILVAAKYLMVTEGAIFLERCTRLLAAQGIELRFTVMDSAEDSLA